MSKIAFDCSQFVSIKIETGQISLDKLKAKFEENGFRIRMNTEIEQVKIDFLSNIASEITIEIVDKEFMGEFEDWKEKDIVPVKVDSLVRTIDEIRKKVTLTELRIILAEFVSFNERENTVVKKQIANENLREELFYASKLNFEFYGNVYIFSE